MSKIYKEFKEPKEIMPIQLAKWCGKNNIADCSFYDSDAVHYWWNFKDNRLDRYSNGEFRRLVNEASLDATVNYLQQGKGITGWIGMVSEGALNHALCYGTDDKLATKFKTYLEKYGYECLCLKNCYYIIYRLPHSYEEPEKLKYSHINDMALHLGFKNVMGNVVDDNRDVYNGYIDGKYLKLTINYSTIGKHFDFCIIKGKDYIFTKLLYNVNTTKDFLIYCYKAKEAFSTLEKSFEKVNISLNTLSL